MHTVIIWNQTKKLNYGFINTNIYLDHYYFIYFSFNLYYYDYNKN